MIVEIKIALDENNLELAERIAHTLRGTTRNMSANAAYEAATKLETAIKTGDLISINQELNNTERDTKVLFESLKQLKATVDQEKLETMESDTDPAKLDLEKIKGIIKEMDAYLKNDDTEAEKYFDELKKHLMSVPGMIEDLTRLEKLLGQYDFESSVSALTEIAKVLKISLTGD